MKSGPAVPTRSLKMPSIALAFSSDWLMAAVTATSSSSAQSMQQASISVRLACGSPSVAVTFSVPLAMRRSRKSNRPRRGDCTKGVVRKYPNTPCRSPSGTTELTRMVGSLSSSASSCGCTLSQKCSSRPRIRLRPAFHPGMPDVRVQAVVRWTAARKSLDRPSTARASSATLSQSGSSAALTLSPMARSAFGAAARSSARNSASYSRSSPAGDSSPIGANKDSRLYCAMVLHRLPGGILPLSQIIRAKPVAGSIFNRHGTTAMDMPMR